MRKIGLLGGTFDPIHIGHILLGQWAMEAFALDEVWFLPAGAPYFKDLTGVTPPGTRLRMTELALEGLPGLKSCAIELERAGNTYTSDTVEALNARFPDCDFHYIFGADCLDALETWHAPERILAGCAIIAAARGGSDLDAMRAKAAALTERFGGTIHVMDFPAMDISSTLIRRRVGEGRPIRFLVPEAVERFIDENGLYR